MTSPRLFNCSGTKNKLWSFEPEYRVHSQEFRDRRSNVDNMMSVATNRRKAMTRKKIQQRCKDGVTEPGAPKDQEISGDETY